MFFIEYWYFTLALIATIILTLFVMSKAGKAIRLNNIEKEKLIAMLEHEKELREAFKTLNSKTFSITDNERLVEGVAMNIHMSIEKVADIDNAFSSLPKPKRYVYALETLLSECEENPLQFFFDKFVNPLTPNALEGAKEIIGGEFAKLVENDYRAFDSENDEISLIKSEIEKNDEKFSSLLKNDKDKIYKLISTYIIENQNDFV